MKTSSIFTFGYKVAEKPNRWVSDLTVIAQSDDPQLGIDDIQDRVTKYLETGENIAMLRELRGDISFDWRSQGPATFVPKSAPVLDEDGLRIFSPIRGVKMAGAT